MQNYSACKELGKIVIPVTSNTSIGKKLDISHGDSVRFNSWSRKNVFNAHCEILYAFAQRGELVHTRDM